MTTSQIVIVLAVSALAAIIKSTTGMGYPLILIPVLALFIDVTEAVALVSPSNFFLNAKLVWSMREQRSQAKTLPRFVAGGVVGSIIGTALLPVLPNNGLRIVLIVVIVLFLFNKLSPRSLSMSDAQSQRLAPGVGLIGGVFQGAAGISGPIVTPWFLSLGLARDTYIYAITSVFALVGLVQLVVLTVQGSFSSDIATVALLLIPLAYLMFPLGKILRERVSVQAFEWIVLGLLALSAVSLAVRLL